MTTFQQIFALLVLLGGAAAADTLISNRHKQKWYDLAVKYWVRLEDTRIPDILNKSAVWLVKASDKLLVNKKTVTVVYLIASSIFVCIAYGFNGYLEGDNWLKGNEGDLWDILPTPHIVQILTVIGFDFIALMLMRIMLIKIRASLLFWQLLHLLFHGICLIVLMILCLATIRHEESWLINNNVIGERGAQRIISMNDLEIFKTIALTNEQTKSIIQSNLQVMVQYATENYTNGFFSTNPQVFLDRVKRSIGSAVYSHVNNPFYYDVYQSGNAFIVLSEGYRATWVSQKTTHFLIGTNADLYWKHDDIVLNAIRLSDFLLTSTLIFPAIIFVCILIFVYISRLVVSGTRRIAMYSFELLTDRKPKDIIPFTLLAAVATICLILLKIFYYFFHLIYHN
jgi:hypothetical protein